MTTSPASAAVAVRLPPRSAPRLSASHTVWVWGAAQAGVLLLLWSLRPTSVVPSPSEVLHGFSRMWWEGELIPAVLASVKTSGEALLLTALISLPLAYRRVFSWARPLVAWVSAGRFLGLVGLPFLFMLALGGGHALKVALLTFGMSVFTVTGLSAEVEALPRAAFDHARNLGLSKVRVLWEVVVRGTFDRALELLRQNAAMGWTLLTRVEGLVRSEGGVGVLLLEQHRNFHLPELFALQALVLGLGFTQDFLLRGVHRMACPYAHLVREETCVTRRPTSGTRCS